MVVNLAKGLALILLLSAGAWLALNSKDPNRTALQPARPAAPATARPVARSAACDNAREIYNEYITEKRRDGAEVYVSRAWPRMFSGFTFSEKEQTMKFWAECYTPNKSLTIYDGHSGRKLASYGPFRGFRLH